MAAKIPFEVPVIAFKTIDGDTLDLLLDLGFGVRYQVHGRVQGIDAPEKNTVAGGLVLQITSRWAVQGQTSLRWRSLQLDKYGRSLGELIYGGTREPLSDYLLNAGLAKAYSGEGKRTWDANELALVEEKARKILGQGAA